MPATHDPAAARTRAAAEAHATAALLLAVAERTRHAFEATVADAGLTAPQARALLALGEAAPMRAIAGALHCDASNVTGIADRLASRGLVTREPDPSDRRVKLLAVTPEGARVRAALERAIAEASPVMAALAPDEREDLRRLLAKAVGPEPTPQDRGPA